MSKAANYIQLLHDARCDGEWDAVPELVRKVRKHAPDRKCLTLTAEIECAIEKNAQKLSPSAERPATADGAAKELEVSSELPRLLTAIDAETSYPEDKFQANVCVGWLHWVVGEYNLAANRLPRTFESEQIPESQVSEWTRVCSVKSAYLSANVLARAGNRLEALLVFKDGLPSLSAEWTYQKSRKQLRYWSELFLTEYCMMFSSSLEKGETTLDDPNSLACYRSWARYWESVKGVPVLGGYGFRGSIPRRVIWGQYYAALSAIVEEDLPFPTGYIAAPITNESSSRNQLRAELKTVEKIHETLLLNETEFPNAEEEREEIEEFVDLACQNWRILCGRGWREQDLGPGGREGLSRGVLDILYRASMKTYHSTSILRHLFTIHISVAEFDLAFKAFDSYLELIKKGKARVQKSGHPEPSLDDEATVLETVAAAIATLCRYGHRQASERAIELAAELEDILNKLPTQPLAESASTLREDESAFSAAGEVVPPRIIALAWQAIGLANAQWARMTFDSSSRGDIHAKAIKSLKKSLSGDLKRTGDIRGIFALGVLLAEQRDLTPAIELTKSALLLGKTSPGTQNDLHNGTYWRERSLVPVWHLLSLLLSARQDFVMASRACEGAFEQFKDPAILFGNEQVFRSDHLNEAGKSRGLVDGMDDFEKEGILEVKMTQLALVELLEGPKVAVNASLELLSLFNRLFGAVEEKKTSPPRTSQGPKSSAGTMRSIRGSIFGRSDKERSGRPATRQPSTLEPTSTRPTTTHSTAPTIQVTQEDGDSEETNFAKKAATVSGRRSQSQRRQSLRKKDSSRGRSASVGPAPQHPTVVDGESYFTPVSEMGPSADFFATATKRPPSSAGAPVALTRTFSQAESFASSSKGRTSAADFSEVSRGSIEFSPMLLPLIQFPRAIEQRRRSTILIKVWLMIAGFYRRAELYDDAKAAIAEAQRLLQILEATVAKEERVSFGDAGWANSKSIDELWGDVWAELGNLSIAKDVPYSARSEFESALTHCPAHPAATIGLSNILLDLYSEKLPPPPTIPGLQFNSHNLILGTKSAQDLPIVGGEQTPKPQEQPSLPNEPLGLRTRVIPTNSQPRQKAVAGLVSINGTKPHVTKDSDSELKAPYKALSLPIVDRLAARDRAYGLLSGLTKLGSAWNISEAWFTLARAHEESGQVEKAREVLWWCVELEESVGVREWRCLGNGGYIL